MITMKTLISISHFSQPGMLQSEGIEFSMALLMLCCNLQNYFPVVSAGKT